MMKRGFTLIELSVVLAVLAVVMAGGLSVLTVSLQQTQYNDTLARISAIEKALADYAAAFGRLPCPGDLTLPPTNANYGAEAGSSVGGKGTGECYTSMTPAANYKSSSGAEEGAVPTRTLQLPDSYMYDAWGRKFRYAVNPDYTGYTFNSKAPFPNGICYSSSKGITVQDATGATRTSSAVYVLFSHGANGHGAYTKTGGRVNAWDNNSEEQFNCHCDSSGVDSGSYLASYIQHAPTYQSSHANDATYRFDDLVAFRIPWQLQSQNSQISGNCTSNTVIWIADYSNSRIVEFSTLTGSYVTSISSTTSPAFPFGNTNSVALDSAGNIWVADTGNRVVELDSAGNWKKTLGGAYTDSCAGTANGASCSNISSYDGSHSSTCCVPSSGSCLCNSGAANGQFDTGGAPTQMAFDSSGHLWVTDYNNKRLQEFNASTGAWMKSVSLSGNPAGMVIDSSNIFWIMEETVHALYKYDGTTETAAGYSSFSNAGYSSDYMAIDTSNNIWVTDEGNNKVKKFSSSGVFSSSLAPTGVSGNTGIFFDSQGYAWLASENSNSIYKVNPSTGTILLTINTANGTGFGSPQLSFSNAR
ncbi:MAG TPA: NHL repeat-containing protein [Rickettsiales bacterium]|nr:NHL repeat-containing protein [Rickettsiales bacterium]